MNMESDITETQTTRSLRGLMNHFKTLFRKCCPRTSRQPPLPISFPRCLIPLLMIPMFILMFLLTQNLLQRLMFLPSRAKLPTVPISLCQLDFPSMDSRSFIWHGPTLLLLPSLPQETSSSSVLKNWSQERD